MTTAAGIYQSTLDAELPPPTGGHVADVDLPDGRLMSARAKGGFRGTAPLLWVSSSPIGNVVERWKSLARAFPETGLWPLVVVPTHGIDRMPEVMMDVPRSVAADPLELLSQWWDKDYGDEEDEFGEETLSPFGRRFPGAAPRSPGDRPASIEPYVSDLEGHLGIVAVSRPSATLETIGWMGPANYDMNPTEQSAILETWEDRFDAYLVAIGFDTITLAVGRPPVDLQSATPIAAEHLAFCPDNIFQGAESIGAYAPLLVGNHRWDFWWD